MAKRCSTTQKACRSNNCKKHQHQNHVPRFTTSLKCNCFTKDKTIWIWIYLIGWQMGLVTNPKQLCLTSFASNKKLKFWILLRSYHVRSDLEYDKWEANTQLSVLELIFHGAKECSDCLACLQHPASGKSACFKYLYLDIKKNILPISTRCCSYPCLYASILYMPWCSFLISICYTLKLLTTNTANTLWQWNPVKVSMSSKSETCTCKRHQPYCCSSSSQKN